MTQLHLTLHVWESLLLFLIRAANKILFGIIKNGASKKEAKAKEQ